MTTRFGISLIVLVGSLFAAAPSLRHNPYAPSGV